MGALLMDMSLQNTLRLIYRMFDEGHPQEAEALAKRYLLPAADHIDALLTELIILKDRLQEQEDE